jgi:hypothetical protein
LVSLGELIGSVKRDEIHDWIFSAAKQSTTLLSLLSLSLRRSTGLPAAKHSIQKSIKTALRYSRLYGRGRLHLAVCGSSGSKRSFNLSVFYLLRAFDTRNGCAASSKRFYTTEQLSSGVGFHTRIKTLLQVALDSTISSAGQESRGLGVVDDSPADSLNTTTDSPTRITQEIGQPKCLWVPSLRVKSQG